MNKVLAILLVLAILSPNTAQAGDAYDILLGTVYGGAFGILAGGTALAFLTDDPDSTYPIFIWVGSGVGMAAGAIFGYLLPDDENRSTASNEPYNPAIFNLNDATKSVWLDPRAIAPRLLISSPAPEPGLYSNLFKLRFD